MNKIDAFVRLYPWLFSLISLILGLLIGAHLNYWNALKLARRKEFNDIAERVRPLLEKELIERNPFSEKPKASDLYLIRSKMRWWRKDGYGKAVLSYEQAHKGDTKIIEGALAFEYSDEKPIEVAINNLLAYLEYR